MAEECATCVHNTDLPADLRICLACPVKEAGSQYEEA